MRIKFSKIIEFTGELKAAVDKLKDKLPRQFIIETKMTCNEKGRAIDTFDAALQRTRRSLIQCGKDMILLDENAGLVVSQSSSQNWRFISELNEGVVKNLLNGITQLRAFNAIADFNLQLNQLLLLDKHRKTHVRIHIYQFDNGKEMNQIGVVQPLLGYEDSCNMLVDTLAVNNLASEIQLPHLYTYFGKTNDYYCAKPNIEITIDDHAVEAANKIITTFIYIARQNETGIIKDVDTEFVHDFRVSLRKIRSVLSLFHGVYDPVATTEFKHAFANIMKETNRLRDLDVYLLDRKRYFSMLPSSMHDGLNKMFAMIADDRRIEQKRVAALLVSDEYQGQMDFLENKFKQPESINNGPLAWEPALTFACTLIYKRYQKVCKIAREIKRDTPDEIVHSLRIQCKKLRYLMEFFSPLFPEDKIVKLVKSLKVLQENLGRFNDFSVQQMSLQTLLKEHSDNDNCDIKLAECVGGLITVLHQRQLKERDQVIQNFLTFDSSEIRMTFKTLFKNGDRV